MYRRKDRKTLPLFPQLFPFGGKLNENNHWLRISELIPWENLESEYAKHFSDVGRPGTDAQLAIGLLLLKHMTLIRHQKNKKTSLHPYDRMDFLKETFTHWVKKKQ